MEKEIRIPDIGGATGVDVIEVQVAEGDQIAEEQSLITLEGDKATMEIPAPFGGVVKSIKIAVGDKVSEGDLILMLEVAGDTPVDESSEAPAESTKTQEQPKTAPTPKAASAAQTSSKDNSLDVLLIDDAQVTSDLGVHAGPAVRRMAKELGVNLTRVKASGDKGRILKQDVDAYVKAQLAGVGTGGSAGPFVSMPAAPVIDFSKFGEVETQPLSRIKKATGVNLQRSWVTVPHVTQFDQADITEMEAFRKRNKADAEVQGFKFTPLVFVMKAVVASLKKFPSFNASLDPGGENLYLKKYFHIGVAVDTPNGLVVPVIRHVDKKSLFGLAQELGEISAKARAGTLSMTDMQGGCFTISSLGGIGGTHFTPIVNAPEVGILGVSKSFMAPVYQDGSFVPRLMLPLSLSYDHRVIDGAEGARFLVSISSHLADVGSLLL